VKQDAAELRLKCAGMRPGDISSSPGSIYRKLAAACILQAEKSPHSMSRSLLDLADVYIRVAKVIETVGSRSTAND
jgi:hypothetical protein